MKEGYKKCPFCANEIKEGAIKCPFCEEFLDGRSQGEKNNEQKKEKKNYKKIYIILGIILGLIIAGLIIFLVINQQKKDSWQGIYYPVGLTHNDGEQTYGPIFENYKACEERGLYLLKNENRASMCTSQCHGTAAGLPLCDKVVRSWKPFPSSEVYEGIDDTKSDTDELFNLFTNDTVESNEEVIKNDSNAVQDLNNAMDEFLDNNDDTNNDKNNENNDNLFLTQFLLDTEDLYCGYKVTINNFIDGPKEAWYKNMTVNGNDVPSQRVLAQRLLNQMEQENVFVKEKGYMERYADNSYFYDTVRQIGLVHDYTVKFLESDKELKDFDEFQSIMLTDFTAAAQSLSAIPSTLEFEYDDFIYKNEQSKYKLATKNDVDLSKNLKDIDSVCIFSVNAVNSAN